MQLEHGPARARRLAVDRFRLGEARSIDAMLEAFDATMPEEVRAVAMRWMGPAWRANATQSIVGPAS